MAKQTPHFDAVTVTLNPAIDRTIVIANFATGAVNRACDEHSQPAGKGVNVASALADHGWSVAVTGFLGKDNAESFGELFARKKITDHFVRIVGQVRTGIKITDPITHQTTDINFPGPAPAPADLETVMHRLNRLDAGYFVLAGSLPPGVKPAIYKNVIISLHARGKKVVLDACGEPLRKAMEARPYLIKPNIHELEELLGESLPDKRSVIKAARRFTARGIELVVVSMGRRGACFVTADKAVIARPPDVEVKSTVGAGDAMVAGTLAGLLDKMPLSECAKLATAFSLDVLMSGKSGVSSRKKIKRLMNQVVTREWTDTNG